MFAYPKGVSVITPIADKDTDGVHIYVADTGNYRVRLIKEQLTGSWTAVGTERSYTVTTFAGTGTDGLKSGDALLTAWSLPLRIAALGTIEQPR